jgi:hypothetical protein
VTYENALLRHCVSSAWTTLLIWRSFPTLHSRKSLQERVFKGTNSRWMQSEQNWTWQSQRWSKQVRGLRETVLTVKAPNVMAAGHGIVKDGGLLVSRAILAFTDGAKFELAHITVFCKYFTGFGAEQASEAVSGALPQGQVSAQPLPCTLDFQPSSPTEMRSCTVLEHSASLPSWLVCRTALWIGVHAASQRQLSQVSEFQAAFSYLLLSLVCTAGCIAFVHLLVMIRLKPSIATTFTLPLVTVSRTLTRSDQASKSAKP